MSLPFLTFPLPDLSPEQATKIDQNPQQLADWFQRFKAQGLWRLRVPIQWGGLGLELPDFYRTQVNLCRASGALTFLQTQHQSACALLGKLAPPATQSHIFTAIARGEMSLGLGVSHLRRRDSPWLQAVPVAGGYRVTGKVPWLTGCGIFSQWLGGAILPQEQVVYGLFPFPSAQTPGLMAHPLALTAMQSTQTVSLIFQDWFLPADQAIVIKPYADTQLPNPIKTLHHGFFALGCALGALDYLRDAQQQAPMNVLEQLIEQYQVKVSQMNNLLFEGLTDAQLSITTATERRSQAIYLCQQLSQIAITAAGGAGNLRSHRAQRLYREALMFSVSGQTSAYRQMSLQQFQRMASLTPPA